MRLKVIILIFACTSIHCSRDYNQYDYEAILEEISEDTDESVVLDLLEQLSQNPLPLRAISASKLSLLPGISLSEAEKIVDLVKDTSVTSISLIANKLSLNSGQSLILETCTNLEYESREAGLGLNYRFRTQTYLDDPIGYSNGRYPGNPLDYYHRLKVSYGNLFAGALINKDPGEEKIDDFRSFYVEYQRENTQFIAGDFLPKFGMGNILWSSFGPRKGAETVNGAFFSSLSFSPYTSSIDYYYFRGAAANHSSIISDDFKINGGIWYANSPRSGNIEDEKIVSVYKSGYYRTENEIEKKNAFEEICFGGFAGISRDKYTISYSHLGLQYPYEVFTESSADFFGESGGLNTIYAAYNLEDLYTQGEFTLDANSNFGMKSSLLYKSSKIDAVLGIRHFDEEFRSPFGTNFGEFSNPSNEQGIYLGFLLKGWDWIKISSYIDFFKSNSRTYYVIMPVKGFELFSEAEIETDDDNFLIIRFKHENKSGQYRSEAQLPELIINDKFNLRIEYNHEISGTRFRTRFEATNVQAEKVPNEWGYLLFVDGTGSISFLQFNLRLTYFNTNSYNSAIWQFEYAMPGLMSTGALFGDGIRAIAKIGYRFERDIAIWLRFTATHKFNAESMGSGNDLILGDTDRRLYFQVDINI